MANGRPPAVQWYPRDFAAAMYRVGASDEFELAYRRALDASFEDGAFGVGSPDEWCRWGRVAPEGRAGFLETLDLLCATCADGTIVQVRMARDRMDSVFYRRSASNGGVAAAEGMTPEQRSDRARKASYARWGANESLPMLTDANTASASASASAVESTEDSKDKTVRKHSLPHPAPAFVFEDLKGKPERREISFAELGKWQDAYPGVDVAGCLSRMVAWLDSHPARKKTARGIPAFVTSWLSRELESAPTEIVPPVDRTAEVHRRLDRARLEAVPAPEGFADLASILGKSHDQA